MKTFGVPVETIDQVFKAVADYIFDGYGMPNVVSLPREMLGEAISHIEIDGNTIHIYGLVVRIADGPLTVSTDPDLPIPDWRLA